MAITTVNLDILVTFNTYWIADVVSNLQIPNEECGFFLLLA